MSQPTEAILDDLVLRAIAAAGSAAALLADRPDELRVSSKSTATDAVTHMDIAAENLLVERLLAGHPGDGVLGEESGERAGTSDVRWVLDPLDGTVNYLYGQPSWGVSVAAEWRGSAVVGVVVAPGIDRAWWAAAGRGAWGGSAAAAMNAPAGTSGPWASLACTQTSDLGLALVGTGFGYRQDRRRAQGRVVAGLLPDVRDVRRAGAAAVDLCAVADGSLDAYYERGLQPWDHAAGVLIAREAGAVCGGLRGADASGDLVVAAAPGISAELFARLEALRADQD